MNRRGLLGGLLVALAAPAIIRTPGLLMPRPDAWAAHVHEHGVRARKAYRLPGVTR